MFGWFRSFSRRLRKPVRLHATKFEVFSIIAALFHVITAACKAIMYGIVPPPVKVDTPDPLLIVQRLVRIHGVKAWLYSMFSRWHIDTDGARIRYA